MTWSTSYYHYDALGSARQLTNAAEATTDSYDYDAWGSAVSSSGTTQNTFHWNGRSGYYWDSDSWTNYVRARHYAPSLGRWLSVSPYELQTESILHVASGNDVASRYILNPYIFRRQYYLESDRHYYNEYDYKLQLVRAVERYPNENAGRHLDLFEYTNAKVGTLTSSHRLEPVSRGRRCLCPNPGEGITGECTIRFYAGHFGPEAVKFIDTNLRTNESIVTGCGNYVGVLTCFSGVLDKHIPEANKIPGFPDFGARPLRADKAYGAFLAALRDSRSLARRLCRNRKTFVDDGQPERYECGSKNQRCDTVTIDVTCDSDMRKLFTTGFGPDGTKVLEPKPFTRKLCDTSETYECCPNKK